LGYEGLYQISNLGRVLSLPRTEKFKTSRYESGVQTRVRKSKILSESKTLGYPTIILHKDGKPKGYLIHRLVATAFIGNPQNLPEVNHLDGVKTNNRPSNLEWTSRTGNSLHSTRVLKKNIGGGNKASKLTESQVLEIKTLLDLGTTQTTIAKRFNVTNHCVYRIHRGYNWAWLTGYGKEGK